MKNFFRKMDSILRCSSELKKEKFSSSFYLHMFAYIFLWSFLYGACMGTYGGVWGERGWQLLFSACKLPLLFTLTFFLSLPSYFILNTLAGLREDFSQVMASLLYTQVGLNIILFSFAPLTVVWYLSVNSYSAAVLFNCFAFAVASLSAQILLKKFYQDLIFKDRKHLILLRVWIFLYAFVGIQLGWVLRPFIGTPNTSPQFFREEAWNNAYIIVLELIWKFLAK